MSSQVSSHEFYVRRWRFWKLSIIGMTALMALTILVSLNIGFAQIEPSHVLKILAGKLPVVGGYFQTGDVRNLEEIILLQIRMPRIMVAALVGAALSIAGVVFQGIFRNPMADPYVIGISSGAALGAALAIMLGVGGSILGMRAIPILAFILALLAAFLVYNLARVGARVPVTTLLLSGIAVSVLLSAILSFIVVISGEDVRGLLFWLLGGFSRADWTEFWTVFPLIALSAGALYLFSRDLNLMLVGEEAAQTLGVEVERSKKFLLIFGSLATAASVSISGLIGFVGLVVPHFTRLLIGPDHRILIPASMLAGSTFLIACDALARVVFKPGELPIGVVTALIGGPFFIYLLRRKKGSYEFR